MVIVSTNYDFELVYLLEYAHEQSDLGKPKMVLIVFNSSRQCIASIYLMCNANKLAQHRNMWKDTLVCVVSYIKL